MHPLKKAEAPKEHADVTRFRKWRNELTHGVAWDVAKADLCAAVMWGFIERQLQAAEQPVKEPAAM